MIRLYPVAYVRNDVPEPIHEGWDEIVSELVVEPRFAAALNGIEDYSHLVVLFWIHDVPPARRRQLEIHPRDRQDLPLVGVFATRTQYRPNPIGLTVVRLRGRRGNVLVVQGLDAIDGTPVLDIKPYLPRRDEVAETKVPEWMERLREGK